MNAQLLTCVWLLATLQTVACQTPLYRRGVFAWDSWGKKYWNGLPIPPPGIFQLRDWTHISGVSCIGRKILYHWATWEANLLFDPMIICKNVSNIQEIKEFLLKLLLIQILF